MKRVEAKDKVRSFLASFIPKFEVWGIFFIDRVKNDEAMAALGITPAQREDIIRGIEVDDYIETIADTVPFGDLWVFGKDYSGEELYIKISLGRQGSRTICISFQKSEYPNKYAFKEERNDKRVR